MITRRILQRITMPSGHEITMERSISEFEPSDVARYKRLAYRATRTCSICGHTGDGPNCPDPTCGCADHQPKTGGTP